MYETQNGNIVNNDCYGCGVHTIEIINETMQKCTNCKRYFKEVDMNGVILKEN